MYRWALPSAQDLPGLTSPGTPWGYAAGKMVCVERGLCRVPMAKVARANDFWPSAP
jgi:hypothetical protein